MKQPYLIVLLAFITFACNTRKIKKISLNPAVAARYNFKLGTYWVYTDSVTGGLDSFVVGTSLHYSKLTPDDTKGPYDLEIIDIPVAHYYNGVRNSMTSIIQLVQDSCSFTMLLADATRTDSAISAGGAIPYPLNNANSSFVVNGSTFNNVALRGTANYLYLCSEEAFLIKLPATNKSRYPCTSLSLLRYHIVR